MDPLGTFGEHSAQEARVCAAVPQANSHVHP